MADSRVIDVKTNEPDSSGVGEMLFGMLSEGRKSAIKIQETDAIEGIKAKYQQANQQKANDFDRGMEQLRSTLRIQETEMAHQREQQLRQQEAAGLEQMVRRASGAGVPLPGLTERQDTPEAGMSEIVPGKIDPNALTAARSTFTTGITKHLDEQAKRTGLSVEADKARMLQELDLIDDRDARVAQSLAGEFEATGDKRMAQTIRSLYGTAGQGSKTAWMEFQKNGLTKLEVARAGAASKLAISREITQRNLEIAKLRTEAQRAIANTKVDDKSYQSMYKLHQAYQGQIAGLDRLHKRTQDSYYTESDPIKQMELQRQMSDLEAQMRAINEEASAIREKMLQWTPARPEAAGTPGVPVPAAPAKPRKRFNPTTGRME